MHAYPFNSVLVCKHYFKKKNINKVKIKINFSPTGSPTSTLCQLHSNHHLHFLTPYNLMMYAYPHFQLKSLVKGSPCMQTTIRA